MLSNSYAKFRWSRVYESSEEELLDFLAGKGITAKRWTAEEFQDLGGQVFPTDTTIYCAEGSLSIEIGTQKISLQPGDAINLDANTTIASRAGISGCVCYQTDS